MGALLRPVGSQPAWVYWARRGAVVLALVLLVAFAVYLVRPPADEPVTAVPATTAATSAPVTPTATPTDSATPTASPTPTGPLACDAGNSTLAMAGYQKVKQGARQPFRFSLTNTGAQSCVLDLKPASFSLSVTSGTDRIWSTEDCEKWVPSRKTTLKAGQAFEFSVVWPVARSAAGCKTAKSALGDGTYVASAAFATDAKARQVFVVAKAT